MKSFCYLVVVTNLLAIALCSTTPLESSTTISTVSSEKSESTFHETSTTIATSSEPSSRTFSKKPKNSQDHYCESISSNGGPKFTCFNFWEIPNAKTKNNSIDTHKVWRLELNANQLTKLKTNELLSAGYDSLRYLWVKSNQINEIENGAFNDIEFLVEIDLSFNKIKTLNMQVFNKLNDLKILKLNNNPIHTLNGNEGLWATNLEKLYLHNCKLQNITDTAFTHLKKLMELRLDSNKLERLSWKNFDGSNNKTLTTLRLEYNSWVCDYHLGLLRKKIQEYYKHLTLHDKVNCTYPTSNEVVLWSDLTEEQLYCPPRIIFPESTGNNENQVKIEVQSTDTKVKRIECKVEAYPEPSKFKWMNNGEDISNQTAPCNSRTSSSSSPYDKDYNYEFCRILTINNFSKNDSFECVAENAAGKASRSVFLHVTDAISPEEEIDEMQSAGVSIWVWILLAILIAVLAVALLVALYCLWVRKGNTRQARLKDDMLKKFEKGKISSPTVNTQSTKSENNDTTDSSQPLLKSEFRERSPDEPSPSKNGMQSVESPSEIFSPRVTPTAEMRRQFFADSGFTTKAQYSPTQSQPQQMMLVRLDSLGERGPQTPDIYGRGQFVPPTYFPLRRPGSSQSLIAYPVYAPMPPVNPRYRKYSNPPELQRLYGSGRGRPPSVSSMASDVGHFPRRQGFGRMPGWAYSTLPRSYSVDTPETRGQLSPTDSVSSARTGYNTIKLRRPMMSNGVICDDVGPRTDAAGSSLSLNQVGSPEPVVQDLTTMGKELGKPPLPGKIVSGNRKRMGSATTPSSYRGLPEQFSFEPIMEVDGSEDSSFSQLSENIMSKLPPKPSQYRRKPAPVVNVNPKVRKPVRTFQYKKPEEIGGSVRNDVESSSRSEDNASSSNVGVAHDSPSDSNNLAHRNEEINDSGIVLDKEGTVV